MVTGPTVKAYTGSTHAESQALFAADAAQAAASGWVPVSQSWDGTTLIVTYASAAPPPAAASHRKRRRPWIWIGAIVVGVLVVGGIAGGSRDRQGATGDGRTPAPAATPAPTVAMPAIVVTDGPTVTTRTSVGDTIEVTFKVRNDGPVNGSFVVGMQELSRHALFVGCQPECLDLGESFTGQKVGLPAPRPGESRTYTITWQATSAARATWSMWLSADDDDLNGDDPGWEATTVILL